MTEYGVGQEYQLYLTTVLGRAIAAALDEEFVVGLDLSTNDSFVSPIRQELQTFEAPDEKGIDAGTVGEQDRVVHIILHLRY